MVTPAGTPARAPAGASQDGPAPGRTGVRRLLGSTPFRVLALVAVAAVLRPPLAGVGPILGGIRVDLHLSGAGVSLLTALPVLCFGAGAFAAPALARRFGLDAALSAVLAVLAAALLARVLAGQGALFAGTLVAGAAIAVANVLLPAVVKEDFPHRVGVMTGVYTSALAGSAALAALLAVPLTGWTGHGWRGSLGTWAAVTAVALAVWLPQHLVPAPARVQLDTPHPARRLLRVPLAWAVTGFIGLQSLGFYSVLTWLPTLLTDRGYSPGTAGALLSLANLVGIPAGLLVPTVAARAVQQRGYALGVSGAIVGGLLGLLLVPGPATLAWVVLLGLGQGAAFPLALLLVALRSPSTAVTGQLSAMAQGFGYLLAAAGPFLVGAVLERTGGWTAPLLLLVVAAIGQGAAGWAAGRAGTVV